jgi:hypothetical protein
VWHCAFVSSQSDGPPHVRQLSEAEASEIRNREVLTEDNTALIPEIEWVCAICSQHCNSPVTLATAFLHVRTR